MNSLNPNTCLQVEICVQDCFEEMGRCSISPEIWESWFYQWLELHRAELPVASGYELSLRLTDDPEIQSLNTQYRHQDRPTDVLAFAALEVDAPKLSSQTSLLPLYLGDIVISVDTAERQAQQQGHSLQTELAWLSSHGLLHLLGWDHPDDESLVCMLNQQETLLKAIGLTINGETPS
ncbi:MAG: rRNA maturation RNase YbeY [Scytolyngbya sp. HA4215-MV1]|jgi:probable rRNA maturation factor|nr:rRNA maturation RNase YbeY [Scytolyngbya sp. HA4215-MV1]